MSTMKLNSKKYYDISKLLSHQYVKYEDIISRRRFGKEEVIKNGNNKTNVG